MIGKAEQVLLTVAIGALFAAVLLANAENASNPCVPIYGYKVISIYPHDTEAFTEGLIYDKGVLYESTGREGESTLRRVNISTGRVLSETSLPDSLFGEGIAIWKDLVIQLTWQSGTGFVYGKENLSMIKSFTYNTEGWGITTDGKHLIMGDGTDTLYLLDPVDFGVVGQIKVKYNGRPLRGLNELEYINGMIYANIYPTDRIAIISPEDGNVKGLVNLQGLLNGTARRNADVLNGIAYDPDGSRLFVTGKLWPSLFEIKLVDKGNCS